MRRTRRSLSSLAVALVATLALGLSLAPSASAFPPGTVAYASINATRFDPGDTVVVVAKNTTPGELSMNIFSVPVLIGRGTVGEDGTGTVTGLIPAGYSGSHTIQVTGAGGEVFPFSITVGNGVTGGVSAYVEEYSVYDEFDPSLGYATMNAQLSYRGLRPAATYTLVGRSGTGLHSVSQQLTADTGGSISDLLSFTYGGTDRAHWRDGESVTFTLTDGAGQVLDTDTQVLHPGGLAGTSPTDVGLSDSRPRVGQSVHVTGHHFNGTTTTGVITPAGIPAGTYETGVLGGVRGDFTVPAGTAAGTYTLTLTDDIGNTGSTTFAVVRPAPGTFTSVAPTRLLDTRTGIGAATAPVGSRATVAVRVT